MGYLHFYSVIKQDRNYEKRFSSPMGYLHFYSLGSFLFARRYSGFSSPMGYLHFYSVSRFTSLIVHLFSSPMGYLHFYSDACKFLVIRGMRQVLVPYGVSTFLFLSTCRQISNSQSSSRPLWGIYISILLIVQNMKLF